MKKHVLTFIFIGACLMLGGFIWKYKAEIRSLYSGEGAPYATTGWERTGGEWTALTAALYWESAVHESESGLRAFAWTIKNRVRSHDFPDSIRGVVVEGYQKGKRDSCQFSFACNGAGESPFVYCRLMNRDRNMLTLQQCKERWVRYSYVALRFMLFPGTDLTGGANHFWAATHPKPYWYTDLAPGSVRQIGSHYFGWSRYRGSDVKRIAASE